MCKTSYFCPQLYGATVVNFLEQMIDLFSKKREKMKYSNDMLVFTINAT